MKKEVDYKKAWKMLRRKLIRPDPWLEFWHCGHRDYDKGQLLRQLTKILKQCTKEGK